MGRQYVMVRQRRETRGQWNHVRDKEKESREHLKKKADESRIYKAKKSSKGRRKGEV